MIRISMLIFCCILLALTFISCGKDATTPTSSQSLNQAMLNNPNSTMASQPSVNTSAGQGADHHSEQITLSGEGSCDPIGDFGFWIWAQDPEANSPEYSEEAAGSIRLNDLHLATGVEGDLVENPEGTYIIDVDSKPEDDPGPITATFTFVGDPESGPNNTVLVEFTRPEACSVYVDNVVVNVTGPEEEE